MADDHFEQATLAGLMTEGVCVGSDLLVIAHTNFPLQPPSSRPVIHLGFDTGELLREAIARIATMRRGGTATPYLQPAVFTETIAPPAS